MRSFGLDPIPLASRLLVHTVQRKMVVQPSTGFHGRFVFLSPAVMAVERGTTSKQMLVDKMQAWSAWGAACAAVQRKTFLC